MEITTFAYTVGVLELLFGLPLVFYGKQTMKWVDKLLKDELHMRVLGALLTVLGTLVLVNGYEIGTDAEGFIRLLAWLVFLKGLIYAWWPATAARIKKKWLKSEATLTFGGLIATALGVLLMYLGSTM